MCGVPWPKCATLEKDLGERLDDGREKDTAAIERRLKDNIFVIGNGSSRDTYHVDALNRVARPLASDPDLPKQALPKLANAPFATWI
jgi:hypothetical protein